MTPPVYEFTYGHMILAYITGAVSLLLVEIIILIFINRGMRKFEEGENL